MAVNQSLIESARRMYAAEHGVADKTAIAQGIALAGTSVANGLLTAKKTIDLKRKENEKSYQAKVDLLTKITTDPVSKGLMQQKLNELKIQFDEGNRGSMGVFRSRGKRADGAEMMNAALQSLDAWELDMTHADAILDSQGKALSNANTMYDDADNVLMNEAKAGKNFVYNPEGKEPGVYTRSVITGELVRLSNYKPPMEVNTEDITVTSTALDVVGQRANIDTKDTLMHGLKTIVNEVSGGDNFMSLLFDPISDFNFAEEYIESEGLIDENNDGLIDGADKILALENLKASFLNDPQPLTDRWKQMVMDEGGDRWEENQKDKKTGTATDMARNLAAQEKYREDQLNKPMKIGEARSLSQADNSKSWVKRHTDGKYYWTDNMNKSYIDEGSPTTASLTEIKNRYLKGGYEEEKENPVIPKPQQGVGPITTEAPGTQYRLNDFDFKNGAWVDKKSGKKVGSHYQEYLSANFVKTPAGTIVSKGGELD